MANVRNPRLVRRALIAACLALLGGLLVMPAAHADGTKPGTSNGTHTGDGAKVTRSTQEINKAVTEAASKKASSKPVPYYEYRTRINCAAGNEEVDSGCGTAATACSNGQFQHVISRRLMVPVTGVAGAPSGAGSGTPIEAVPTDRKWVPATGPEGQWQDWGLTCFPDLIPGSASPTLAQVMSAFREIDFAKGELSIQPVGNVTLVNLATYFEATWPEAGVGPDETDVSDLMGYRLEIQPVVRSFTYVYGDGDSSEPTESMGGPYPDGDIRHTYEQKGSMSTRVDTVYGGRFRFGQGQWMTIPGTVTVEGTPVTLEVREAKARLYGNANPPPRQ